MGPPGRLDQEWRRLDQKVVEVSTWAATAFMIVLLAVAVASGEIRPILLAMNPFSVAATGWFMIANRRPNVAVQLTVGMTALVASTLFMDLGEAHDPLLGLLAIGVVGSLFSRKRAVAFAGITMVLIGFVAFMHDDGMALPMRIQTAFGAAALMAFIAWLIIWIKRRWMETNAELEDLILSKDRLVASVSHELRTPMTSVVGLARELDERYGDFDEAEIREFLSLIVHESTDVANILEDLLVAARADVGNLTLVASPVDLYEEINAALATTSAATLRRHDRTEPLVVEADPMRIRQILRNLIVNATRYGGPDIRVAVERVDGKVSVAVCDDGDPIPPDERERIFMPYQGESGSGAVPGSVGLGLTVSRQLARLMGGDLEYDHTGRESKFTLTLPAHQPAPVPSVAPTSVA